MRIAPVVIAILALPGVVAAQSAPPSVSAPLPTIGLPLPQISFPLPSISLPLPPRDTQPRIDHRPERRPPFLFFVPVYGWPYYGYPVEPPPRIESPAKEESRPVTSGTLRFDVQPEKLLQVFVNGYYVGTPPDFGSELELELGTHTIELSAPGYETTTFNVKIDGTRPVTYRGTLKPIEPKSPGDVAAQVAGPSTLYYIPGCYLGNVDPKDVKLPDNCDMSRLVTRKFR